MAVSSLSTKVDSSIPDAHYMTADTDNWEWKKTMIRENRKNPTAAEGILWQRLRNSNLGFKIRRQHPIENFIVDFVCIDSMLVIEADGKIHNQQLEYDANRTKIIESFGFKVIRFENERIEKETDKVIAEIKSALESRPKKGAHFWKGDAPTDDLSTDDLSTDDSSSKSSPLQGRGAGGEAFKHIEVFTTRPDTIFGATYLTLAPEHELVSQITTPENKKAVDEYVVWASNRSERERQADVKKITGVFTGAYAEHPFTKSAIPIWVGDYVLAGYGTGAVMAVPAHDTRDFAFAKHFDLPILEVIQPLKGSEPLKGLSEEAYDEKSGTCINSDFLNGLEVKAAIKRAIEEIEKQNFGKGKINFRLRDAIFGRQRYWGEPIPIYYKQGIPYTLPENELPLILPEVDKYLPTESGEPPLARAKNWTYTPLHSEEFNSTNVQTSERPPLQGRGVGGEAFPLETTTMPGWAGSSWYFLRYMDAQNENEFASKTTTDYWGNIDLYLGGSEHATGHLLYVRFWTKFLNDLGYINVDEPAKKLINQGMIQGTSAKIVRLESLILSGEGEDGVLIPMDAIPQLFLSAKKYFDVSVDDNSVLESSITRKREVIREISNFEDRINLSIKEKYPDRVGSVKYRSWNTSNLNIDINCVDKGILNLDMLMDWRNNYKQAQFIREDDGRFICLEEVEKMSKSKYNVVNPDDMCDKYGTDCFRMYEMFLGPLEQSKPWNTNGITGVSGFLKKLWRLYDNALPLGKGEVISPLPWRGAGGEESESKEVTKPELKVLHKTIKKITEDIERFSFNTSVSSFMICVNELTDLKCTSREVLQPLAILLSPYAPHIAEELWEVLGNAPSVTKADWPIYDDQYLIEDTFEYPVSINGKVKFKLSLSLALQNAAIEQEVLSSDKMKELLNGNQPKKVIIVHGKIVNVVI